MTTVQLHNAIYVAAELGVNSCEEISADTTFVEMCFDSLDYLEFVMGVEDECQCEIDDALAELATRGTLEDFVRIVNDELNSRKTKVGYL